MATIFDRLVLVKTETTKGTDAVPTPLLNALRVKSVKITTTINPLNRAVVKQSMGELPHQIGKQTMKADIVVELRGAGAGVAPVFSPLMLACRTAETIVAATSAKYMPSMTEKACTIYIYQDGLLWKFIGSVGDVKVDSSIDGVALATFSMSAAYLAPTAVSCPTNGVFDSTQPLVMSSTTVVNDGAVIKVGQISLAVGNDVQHHYVTGESSFVVANRKPTLTFTKDSVNTSAEWTALMNGSDAAVTATFNGGVGNTLAISAPVARRSGVTYAERAERDTLSVAYSLYESTANDQFTFLFT